MASRTAANAASAIARMLKFIAQNAGPAGGRK